MNQTKQISNLIIEGIKNRKGKSITMIDLSDIEGASADVFIICQGTSNMHVASVADSIREFVHEQMDVKPFSYDGYKNSQWIVIDYGNVMVHVFQPEVRQFYNLEELWSDAPTIDIPDEDNQNN